MNYYPEAVSLAIQPPSELWDADCVRVFERLAATFDAAVQPGSESPVSVQSFTSE